MKFFIITKGDKKFLDAYEDNGKIYAIRQKPLHNIEPKEVIGKYYIYQWNNLDTSQYEILDYPKYCDDELKQWFEKKIHKELLLWSDKLQTDIFEEKDDYNTFEAGYMAAVKRLCRKDYEEWKQLK